MEQEGNNIEIDLEMKCNHLQGQIGMMAGRLAELEIAISQLAQQNAALRAALTTQQEAAV